VALSFDSLVRRSTFLARGLGFAFLTFFLTSFLRDLGTIELTGDMLPALVTGPPSRSLAVLFAVSLVTTALAVLFVRLYSRAGPEAECPRPLLAASRSWWAEWVRGALLGAGLATLAVAPMVVAGHVEILGLARGGFDGPPAWLAVLGILTLEAAREELGFRGPALRDLTRAVSFPLAATFLSASFAIIHAGNPAVGRAGLTGIFVAGMALAGLARARGDLGMVCGVHAAWNVTLGMVWSVPVSGVRLHTRLLSTSADHSPWTGGAFGAEASVPALLVLLGFAVVAWSQPAPTVVPAPPPDADGGEPRP